MSLFFHHAFHYVSRFISFSFLPLFISLGTYTCLKTHIKVDTLSVVHRNSKVVHLYAVLVDSLLRNLKLAENSFLQQTSNCEDSALAICAPEPYHFLPPECGHFVTVMYPEKKPDSELGKHLELYEESGVLTVYFFNVKPHHLAS